MTFMKLTQVIPHNPPATYGDCHRTCLAMVLGLDVLEVPHFADENLFPPDASRDAERQWLLRRGLSYVSFPIWAVWGLDYLKTIAPDTAAIVCGKSPRGDWNHDVVMLRGEVIDPAPCGGGLAGACIDRDKPQDDEKWYWISFIVPITDGEPA